MKDVIDPERCPRNVSQWSFGALRWLGQGGGPGRRQSRTLFKLHALRPCPELCTGVFSERLTSWSVHPPSTSLLTAVAPLVTDCHLFRVAAIDTPFSCVRPFPCRSQTRPSSQTARALKPHFLLRNHNVPDRTGARRQAERARCSPTWF